MIVATLASDLPTFNGRSGVRGVELRFSCLEIELPGAIDAATSSSFKFEKLEASESGGFETPSRLRPQGPGTVVCV